MFPKYPQSYAKNRMRFRLQPEEEFGKKACFSQLIVLGGKFFFARIIQKLEHFFEMTPITSPITHGSRIKIHCAKSATQVSWIFTVLQFLRRNCLQWKCFFREFFWPIRTSMLQFRGAVANPVALFHGFFTLAKMTDTAALSKK